MVLKKKSYGFSVFCKVFLKKPYKNILGFSYFLVLVIIKLSNNFYNGFFKKRHKSYY